MPDALSTPRAVHVVVRRDDEVIWSGALDRVDARVGRSPLSDVVLDDGQVSWTHALLRIDDQRGIVFTDQSSNGSFRDGQRVQEVALGEKGTISIPPFDVEFRLGPRPRDLRGDRPGPEDPTRSADQPPAPAFRFDTNPIAYPPEGQATAALLRFIHGPSALLGTTVSIENRNVTIGRAPDCDVRIDVPGVSRYHARLAFLAPERWTIQDTNSLNGIEVNGESVTEREVGFGDRIGIGAHIVVLLQRPAAPVQPAPSAEAVLPSSLDSVVVVVRPSTIDARATVLSVVGRLDAYTFGYLRDEIAKVVADGERVLIVDLSKCSYCDHAGLGVLVEAQLGLQKQNGGLCMTGLRPQLRDAFTLLRLDQVLESAEDERGAVRVLGRLTGQQLD
jgi:anti-anti-sigma factor